MPEKIGHTTVRVHIGGEEHPIKGEASSDYIHRLARIVDDKITDVQSKNPNLTRHRVAILAALHLADELETLRKEHQELLQIMEEVQ